MNIRMANLRMQGAGVDANMMTIGGTPGQVGHRAVAVRREIRR